jgi:hypothetical protein
MRFQIQNSIFENLTAQPLFLFASDTQQGKVLFRQKEREKVEALVLEKVLGFRLPVPGSTLCTGCSLRNKTTFHVVYKDSGRN